MRFIEYFFTVNKIIVEIKDPSAGFLLGYCSDKDLEKNALFYNWPYYMEGRIMNTVLFDSMITTGLD